MITVQGSQSSSARYILLEDQWIQWDTVQLDSKRNFDGDLGVMVESRGFNRENFVTHAKVEADVILTSSPELGIVPSGSTNYPHAKSLGTVRAYYGVSGLDVGHGAYAATQTVHVIGWSGGILYHFTLANVVRATGRGAGITGSRYTVTSVSDNKVYLHRTVTTSGKVFYCDPEDFGSCLAAGLASNPTWSGGASVSCNFYTASRVISDAQIQSAVDGAVLKLYAAGNESTLDLTDWGELAGEAVSRFNATNINMLEFIADLKNPTRLIPKLRNLKYLKGWAGNYLAVKFGLLPTISDLTEIVAAVRRSRKRMKNSAYRFAYAGDEQSEAIGDVTVRQIQHLKLAVSASEEALNNLGAKIDSIGMLPKLSNIWDLIPFTFAIDWFISVGDFLNDYETKSLIEEFKCPYTVRSVKDILTTPLSDLDNGITGEVRLINYRRWPSVGCPTPSPNLQFQFIDQNHWLEAGALLVQRIK